MSHLWVRDEEEWAVLPLGGDCLELSSIPTPPFRGLYAAGTRRAPALVRSEHGGREEWTLVASSDRRVAVNGIPLRTGIRVLRNRDQLHIPGAGPLFFSSERQARVEPLPIGLGEVFCPRCRQRIVEGSPAVRCPGTQCGLWYHQSDEYPCWLYAPTCAVCPQPTALDAGFQFCPEDL